MFLTDYKTISWKDLDNREWDYLRLKGVCNGCGGAGNMIKQRLVRFALKTLLKRLRVIFIETSCDIHDLSYWQGGNEVRRRECDLGFFQAIIGDVGRCELGFLSVFKYTLLALAFYYAVRIGGKDYFIYS